MRLVAFCSPICAHATSADLIVFRPLSAQRLPLSAPRVSVALTSPAGRTPSGTKSVMASKELRSLPSTVALVVSQHVACPMREVDVRAWRGTSPRLSAFVPWSLITTHWHGLAVLIVGSWRQLLGCCGGSRAPTGCRTTQAARGGLQPSRATPRSWRLFGAPSDVHAVLQRRAASSTGARLRALGKRAALVSQSPGTMPWDTQFRDVGTRCRKPPGGNVSKSARPAFVCAECGTTAPRWSGRCAGCGAWNQLLDQVPASSTSRGGAGARAVPVTQLSTHRALRRSTGFDEFDRVLGGGLVDGAVVLVSGEPGIGKSTLLVQVLASLAVEATVLYVSGEESADQVRQRAERVAALHPGLLLLTTTDLSAAIAAIEECAPQALVVDSIQALADPELPSAAGSPVQVRQVAARLVATCKQRGIAAMLVGQVTKDGNVAGPKTVEHVVDVVVSFEGDRHHALRLVRCTKNRYGPAHEVGCFEMSAQGLAGVSDPGRLFVSAAQPEVPGIACTVSLEGRRPLVCEVQALVVPSSAPMPRRAAEGPDAGRLAILVAVLERRAGVRLGGNDIFTATVGGARLSEPAADLAICLALASAARDWVSPSDLVVLGEVGLGGEVRVVPQLQRRLAEAARLGFRRAFVGTGWQEACPDGAPAGLEVIDVATVGEAVALASAAGAAARSASPGRL